MNSTYAGFWLRLVAWLIDKILLGVIQWVIIGPILAAIGIASSFSFTDFQNIENFAMLIPILTAMVGLAWVAKEFVTVFYHSIMESSSMQGSIGKMAMGVVVTDLEGQRLSFGKAFVRNLCKIISDMTVGIGYAMAGFTEKQQALHDLIAGTLVVKKQTQTLPKSI